jgi:N-acetylgalactosamine-6-sulfatase
LDAQVTGYGTYYSVGETSGLRGRKRSLFEGGVRVPFIVRWPGHTPAGTKNDATVLTAVDLLPTLCTAAGISLPADYACDGENLIATFKGQNTPRTRPIFWQWLGMRAEPDYWPRLAVRDGDWKLVMSDDAQRLELHQLKNDRAESIDMSQSNPDIVARLTKLALDWKATLPTSPNPDCITKHSSEQTPSQAKPSAKKSKTTPEIRAKAFVRWDTNKDDTLSLEEYTSGLKGESNLESRYKNFDQDGNGKLTRNEFIVPSTK